MLIDKKGLQRHNRCPCEFRVDFDLKKPPIKPLLEIVGNVMLFEKVMHFLV